MPRGDLMTYIHPTLPCIPRMMYDGLANMARAQSPHLYFYRLLLRRGAAEAERQITCALVNLPVGTLFWIFGQMMSRVTLDVATGCAGYCPE